MNFNNPRLDELLRHAKNCAAIGSPDLAEDYLHKAVSYGREMGVRVPHDVRGQIISNARMIQKEIEIEFTEMQTYFSGRR